MIVRRTLGPAPRGELAIRLSIVSRHSNEGRPHPDWGVVEFRDGKLTSARFMPD